MFVYLLKCDPKQPNSRPKGMYDGITREYGEKYYSENIHFHTCTNLYNETPSCKQCQ